MMNKWKPNADEKVARKKRMMKNWQRNADDENLARKYG